MQNIEGFWEKCILDDTYQIYLDRVAKLVDTESQAKTLHHIVESPKFAPRPEGGRQPKPFPGYSVITPPWCDSPSDSEFYEVIRSCQNRLCDRLDRDFFVPVPPDSFHFTLADLIWDSAYRDAIAQFPEFDDRLRTCIGEIFQQTQDSISSAHPVRWKVVGLAVMTRAIAACLVPLDEASYDRIVRLRRAIYQNSDLMRLGIEQQYYLTAHVTLGYFGNLSREGDRTALAPFLTQTANDRFRDAPPLHVKRAELRKFEDMTRYDRAPNFPVLTL
ncbi:DUF1868 domain-containing protein [Baaleninema simplex]|uniref:DUF1868 domain-containing protein n=1 Tax=Baaleninema simplex TaxID=2862350 RepID=UPI00034DFB87|nr:DUF1868 domain-containing protein [Baaleninema simplex]